MSMPSTSSGREPRRDPKIPDLVNLTEFGARLGRSKEVASQLWKHGVIPGRPIETSRDDDSADPSRFKDRPGGSPIAIRLDVTTAYLANRETWSSAAQPSGPILDAEIPRVVTTGAAGQILGISQAAAHQKYQVGAIEGATCGDIVVFRRVVVEDYAATYVRSSSATYTAASGTHSRQRLTPAQTILLEAVARGQVVRQHAAGGMVWRIGEGDVDGYDGRRLQTLANRALITIGSWAGEPPRAPVLLTEDGEFYLQRQGRGGEEKS